MLERVCDRAWRRECRGGENPDVLLDGMQHAAFGFGEFAVSFGNKVGRADNDCFQVADAIAKWFDFGKRANEAVPAQFGICLRRESNHRLL